MYTYAITLPFELKWKYAAPRDFESLEYFITPNLSIVLEKITNGKNLFAPGFFLSGKKDRRVFENEFLPRRSQERVEKAFAKDEVSCFFTEEEAKSLEIMFKEEKFICNRVTVLKNGHRVDLFDLEEDEFEKMLEVMGSLGVQQVIDVYQQKEPFNKLRDDMYKAAYKKATSEFNDLMGKRRHITDKKWRKMGFVGGSAIAVATGLKMIGKATIGKGVAGTIVGLVSYAASVVAGLFGVKMLSKFVDQFDEGVIFE